MLLLDAATRDFDNVQEQLDYVLNKSLELTQSKYGYIYIYDEERQEFRINSWSAGVSADCTVENEPIFYQLEKTGIWGEVVRQRKPIVINDFARPDPLKKGYPQGHVELQRFVSIPVIIDQKIVAVVGLGNKEADYEDADVNEMTVLMKGVWNAVARRIAEEKLILERNKYLQTLFSIGEGVMVVDRDGHIEMLNKVAQQLTGWSLEEARGRYYRDVFHVTHENEDLKLIDPVEKVLSTDQAQQLSSSAILTSRNGNRFYLEDSASPIKDDNEQTVGVVVVFRDVSDKKLQREKIEKLSYFDSLTGLYNRLFFEAEMKRLDTKRNLPISIILGDVNGLKLTNDVFGHTCGDELLKKIAAVMRKVCRSDEIIARWGGDEFVLLLPRTGSAAADMVKDRIKEEFAREQVNAIRGSISMGCATKTADESIMDILDEAEERMYTQKAVERSRFLGDAIQSIITALHNRSPREKEHAIQVSRMCLAMGKELGLSENDLRKLKDAGFYHDIGRVVLKPGLLGRSYRLSPQEMYELKRHPIVGYRILSSFDETVDLAEIVMTHQERWDGKGYPKGLRGYEIPLFARIINIVESYERMTSDPDPELRKSKNEALRHIKENSGYQYDPYLVNVFHQMTDGCL